MNILFLSHCVPFPPDKGEKIRAYHEIQSLAREHRVHLACFGRSPSEIEQLGSLKNCCESVYGEPIPRTRALVSAAIASTLGDSFVTSFYYSRTMERYVCGILGSMDLVVVYSVAMARYVPAGTPTFADLVDVDSEKWKRYSRYLTPAVFYRIEARRIQEKECGLARNALNTVFATQSERELFLKFCPNAPSGVIENGVDCDHFDPKKQESIANVPPNVVFVGAMDYFPNAYAASWFARTVLPAFRERYAGFEFRIVGRDPHRMVRALANQPGVKVTGTVPDVRPYLAASELAVVPLPIAQGIQNKVLEALAMGKPVLLSPATARTFSGHLPTGVTVCSTPEQYLAEYERQRVRQGGFVPEIRQYALERFSWARSSAELLRAVSVAVAAFRPTPASMGSE